MKGTAKEKEPLGQIDSAFQVLGTTEQAHRLRSHGSNCLHARIWYVETDCADWIITETLHRMRTVDAVIRDLK